MFLQTIGNESIWSVTGIRLECQDTALIVECWAFYPLFFSIFTFCYWPACFARAGFHSENRAKQYQYTTNRLFFLARCPNECLKRHISQFLLSSCCLCKLYVFHPYRYISSQGQNQSNTLCNLWCHFQLQNCQAWYLCEWFLSYVNIKFFLTFESLPLALFSEKIFYCTE